VVVTGGGGSGGGAGAFTSMHALENARMLVETTNRRLMAGLAH
jgi:hypothetical protein